MPRLKPPPTKEEPKPIVEDHEPPVGDIEIHLPDEGTGETTIDLAAPPAPEPKPAPKPKAQDDSPLQKALVDQQRAEELQRQNTERLQRERDDALRLANERAEELERERGDRQDAQYNSVLTAIAAEQSTIAKAEADYAAHAQAGDWTAAAAAQRLMAGAAARLDRLEDGKQAFESKREAAKTAPPVQKTAAPAPTGFEHQIRDLPENAKTWLRNHPEFVNDTALNKKINATHMYLTDNKGVQAFSTAYFDALDQEFGFKTAAPAPQAAPQPQRRSMPVSAPVSRDVPSATGVRQSQTMTLTEEERKIARTSIMDRPDMPNLTNEQKEYIYAQNKRKLHAMRANGSYRQTTEQTG
jgi:hypothetical protein